MSDDIFTKLDKASAEFDANNSTAWVSLMRKMREDGHTVLPISCDLWLINECMMWTPIDDTKEL